MNTTRRHTTKLACIVAAIAAVAACPSATAHAVDNVLSLDAGAPSWSEERMAQARALEIPMADGRAHVGRTRTAPGDKPSRITTDSKRARMVAPRKGVAKRPGSARGSIIRPRHPNAPITTWRTHGFGEASSAIPAAGRIYFEKPDGTIGVCSGTMVTRNIVMTAAHCLREPGPNGRWMRDHAFVPGTYGSINPYGTFVARSAVATREWIASGDYSMDYGFLVLNPSYGRHAGDYTGTFPILLNAQGGSMYQFGYPAEGPWRASCTAIFCKPRYCNSPIQRYNRYASGHYDVGMSCHISGGASGGPMFQQHGGRWYVASVVSHGAWMRQTPSGREGFDVYGPYLDGSVNGYLGLAARL